MPLLPLKPDPNLNERLMWKDFLLALHLVVLKPPPTFRNRCFVTFYAGPMGLSLCPIRSPRRGGRAACQAALGGQEARTEKGGDTPCGLCLCYHCHLPHGSGCFF